MRTVLSDGMLHILNAIFLLIEDVNFLKFTIQYKNTLMVQTEQDDRTFQIENCSVRDPNRNPLSQVKI